MTNNSDNWITIRNFDGASYYFRRIKKHFCPVCGERLRESYTNRVSWDDSGRGKRLSKKYLRSPWTRANVDERFYCFYCAKCREYHCFKEIRQIEEKSANKVNRKMR